MKQSKTTKKGLLKFAKIGISLGLLIYVFFLVPFSEIWNVIKKSNIFYISLSGLLLLISQIISSDRLLLFFKAKEFHLSRKSNFKLYFIGMFYNFFIPGGIGGDAYKVYLLNKEFQWDIKSLTAAVFFDRINGLLAICFWAVLLLGPIDFLQPYRINFIIPIIIITGYLIARFTTNKLALSFKPIFNKALYYSMCIQGAQLLSVYAILLALSQQEFIFEYLILFLVSAVLSVISFSGIGVREFLFLKAALIFNFNPDVSIAIGLIFTFLTIIISSAGLFFEFSKNKLELNSQSV